MHYRNKRHYRVAQKDQFEDEDTMCLSEDCITRLTVMSIVVYSVSVVISMALGYIIGKNE